MIAFIVRRVFASIGVMIAVGLIAFAMFRYVGDPVNQMVGVETSVAERAQLREELGLNDPVIVQALRFLGQCRALRLWRVVSVQSSRSPI